MGFNGLLTSLAICLLLGLQHLSTARRSLIGFKWVLTLFAICLLLDLQHLSRPIGRWVHWKNQVPQSQGQSKQRATTANNIFFSS